MVSQVAAALAGSRLGLWLPFDDPGWLRAGNHGA